MFLSRLQLNPVHPQARRDLSSAYEMHRSLARVYATSDDAPPARFLWRLEREAAGPPGSIVLVQAAQLGAWSQITDREGYLVRIDANKPVTEDRLVQQGRRYRFRLLANPTVTRSGKRFGLHDDEARMAWLQRQGQRHGFTVKAAERTGSDRLEAVQAARKQRITLDAVLFDGVLEAADANALRHALVTGIGPGKALGLGMLSLAPLRQREPS